MQQGEGDNQGAMLSTWEPNRLLRSVDGSYVKYSRGFLRCRPEKWFPGFGMQWLPLAHSLGAEIKLIEARPVIGPPRGLEVGFAGSVDDEPVGFFMDAASAEVLLEAVCPGCQSSARGVILEYLARRLLASLAISWSGPKSSIVQFEPDMNPHNLREVGAVKLTVGVNSGQVEVWILIGKIIVERLDGLWRRQLHSTSGQHTESLNLHLEVAHLTVPPSLLSDYLKSGTTIDLEVPISETVTLVTSGRPWMPARLCRVKGNLGFETLPGPAPFSRLPSGTTRLSIEFGSMTLEAGLITELAQVGAVYDTGRKLSDRVDMVVNGEKAGDAVLRTYQGRFAVSVL